VISAITGMAYYVTAEQQRKKREKRHELIPEKYRDLI
jgi:preprotein translocase subunit YajC